MLLTKIKRRVASNILAQKPIFLKGLISSSASEEWSYLLKLNVGSPGKRLRTSAGAV